MCAIGIAAPGFMSMLVKLMAADAVPVNRSDSDTPAADLRMTDLPRHDPSDYFAAAGAGNAN